MEERRICSGKIRAFHNIDNKTDQVSRTTKMIVDFCPEDSVSIKYFAIKEEQDLYLEKC